MNRRIHVQRQPKARSRTSFASSRLRVRSCSAFTFAEVLAALVFLAILIPAVMQGITIASRVSVMAERSAIASGLAQNKLDELTINDAWTAAEASGDFGADWTGYRWETTQSTWDMGTMTVLAVKVFYPVQGQENSVSLSTLVYSATASGSSTTTSTSSASSSPGTK